MKIIPYSQVLQINNSELNKAYLRGAERSILSHYTNIRAFRSIVQNRYLKLNRIDLVNDLEEKTYLKDPEVYCLVFVGCFSHRKTESIPQWYMYTHSDKGVRISLHLKNTLATNCTGLIDVNRPILAKLSDKTTVKYNYGEQMLGTMYRNANSQWSMELSCNDIIYSDKAKERNEILYYYNGKAAADIMPAARIKRKAWDFEEETRIVGIFRTVREGIAFEIPEYVLLPIDFSKFNLDITLNPWRTDKFNKELDLICKKYLCGYSYKLHDSGLYQALSKRKM